MTVALSFGLRSQSAHQARSAASRKPPYDVGCCIHCYIPAPVHAPPPSSAQTQHRDLRMACSSGFRNGGPGSNFLSMCVCLYSVPLSFVWFRVLLSLKGMISAVLLPLVALFSFLGQGSEAGGDMPYQVKHNNAWGGRRCEHIPMHPAGEIAARVGSGRGGVARMAGFVLRAAHRVHFFAEVLPRARRLSHTHCGVQIVIHPHEVVGRSRGVARSTSYSSGSKAVLVLAVLGCAALACLAVGGGASAANTSGGSLAETVQSVSARHAPVVPQASRAHFSSKANAASGRMHATQQHLALVKQVLFVRALITP